MTKNTTRKTAAKKTASKSSKDTGPKPMEASTTPPAAVGTPATNTIRVCWAAKTLVEEFTDLFPETPVEYSAPDGRNTMLDVTFDLTAVPDSDHDAAASVLELVESDVRVGYVITDHAGDAVLVSFKSSARTQDSRDSFGLADAWDVLTDGEPEEFYDEPDYVAGPNLVLDFEEESR